MRPKLILLVDDDQDTLDAYDALFRKLGHRTATATDGGAALSAAVQLLPDLIVLDLGLPGMTGIEVLRQLRADHRVFSLRVLVLTGHAFPRDLDEAWQARCDMLLTKPCEPEDLCKAVAALLDAPRSPPARIAEDVFNLRNTKAPRRCRGRAAQERSAHSLQSLLLWSAFLVSHAETLSLDASRLVADAIDIQARSRRLIGKGVLAAPQ